MDDNADRGSLEPVATTETVAASNPGGTPVDTRAQDEEHLRLLSIFHYVVAGLAAAFACIPLFHLGLGILMLTGRAEFAEQDPAAPLIGCFFVAFAGTFILAGWTFAALLALAGRFLAKRRHYNYCLVMGGVACMFSPFGTVLGVFTIITLVRESVKELFGRGGPAG